MPNFSLLPNEDSPKRSSTPVEQVTFREVLPQSTQPPPDPNISTVIAIVDGSDKEMDDTSSVDLFAADREDGELSDAEVVNEPRARSPYRSPSQADFVRLAAKQATLPEKSADVQGKSYLRSSLCILWVLDCNVSG